jgi:hypothetical protein
MVEVEYVRAADGVDARVKVPAGVEGELIWKGRKTLLHGGEQSLHLP